MAATYHVGIVEDAAVGCWRELERHALKLREARNSRDDGREVDVVREDVAVGEVLEVLEGKGCGCAGVVDEDAGGLLFEVVV